MKLEAMPAGANRPKRRLGKGRGNGHGKTCGRGHGGAGSRSGNSLKPGFEGGQMPLYRKLPRRGFNNARFKVDYAVINVGDLERIAGDVVDLESAKSAGIVRRNARALKVLGDGELTKKFTVRADKCSASAKDKIEAVGGTVETS